MNGVFTVIDKLVVSLTDKSKQQTLDESKKK